MEIDKKLYEKSISILGSIIDIYISDNYKTKEDVYSAVLQILLDEDCVKFKK